MTSSLAVAAHDTVGLMPFVTFRYDVAEGGGGFCLWPRTHLATHRHFLTHPDLKTNLLVSFEDVFGVDWQAMESIEFTAAVCALYLCVTNMCSWNLSQYRLVLGVDICTELCGSMCRRAQPFFGTV